MMTLETETMAMRYFRRALLISNHPARLQMLYYFGSQHCRGIFYKKLFMGSVITFDTAHNISPVL